MPSFEFSLPKKETDHEKKENEKLLVPVYNSNDQIEENIDPDWKNKSSYNDSDFYAVTVERTRAKREIFQKRGQSIDRSGEGLMWAIDNLNHEIGGKFDSHGISEKKDPIFELDNFLTKGISSDKPLYSMGFQRQTEAAGAFGAEHPFTDGGIILVSGYGEKLTRDGIKYVVFDESYNRVIDLIRKKYPDYRILTWSEAPAVLTEEAKEISGTDYPIPKLTAENQPKYTKFNPLDRHKKENVIIPTVPSVGTTDSNEDVW
ncbi:MAG TPA: hypothetical protein VK255_02450 [Patescibacteria group bacterium]|nr:hypothetical protein [Patescibacteria group bacterium]